MECPNYFWPWFSEEEYARRYARLREGMAKKGLDCLIVYGISRGMGMEPGQPNVVYLTSVAAWSQTFVVFPLEGAPSVFVLSSNHVKNVRDMSVIKDVRPAGSFQRTGGLRSSAVPVAERIKELGLEKKRIGIVGDTGWLNINLPHDAHVALTGALPGAEFEVVTEWYEHLRLVKSEEEVAVMRRSAAMTDAAYEVMVQATRPGVRPCDLYKILVRVALDLDGRLTLGHVGRTPMKKPDMDYPHYYPLTVPIQEGDVVMTEVGVGVGGYYGKIWGTFFVGDPTPEYERMFQLAAQTSFGLHAAIKPGVKVEQLAPLCLDTIQNAGYRSKTSICGWSNWNAPPDVRGAGDQVTDPDFVFEKNHCINVVGWTSNEEQSKGVWLGDTCVIHADRLENLQKYPIREIHVAR
ncbi:MAG: M24 family metallopeptidase [Nitrospinota bacterium]